MLVLLRGEAAAGPWPEGGPLSTKACTADTGNDLRWVARCFFYRLPSMYAASTKCWVHWGMHAYGVSHAVLGITPALFHGRA